MCERTGFSGAGFAVLRRCFVLLCTKRGIRLPLWGRRARSLPFFASFHRRLSGRLCARASSPPWAGAARQVRATAPQSRGACVPPRGFLFFRLPGLRKNAPNRQNTCAAKPAGPAPALRRALCKGGTPYGFNHNKGYFIFLPRCAGACVRAYFPLARFPLAPRPDGGEREGQKHASAPALRRACTRCRAHCHALRGGIVSIQCARGRIVRL